MIKEILTLFILFFIMVQSGCASIVSGRYQDISVQSNPSGAELTVDGIKMGQTPSVINLKRKSAHSIKLTKVGYRDETIVTDKGLNKWFWGNILLGGLIGIIIDCGTGAVHKIKPEQLNVEMRRQ